MKKNTEYRTTIHNVPAGTDQAEMQKQNFYGKGKITTNPKPFPMEGEKQIKKNT